jgi:hypothetical protein
VAAFSSFSRARQKLPCIAFDVNVILIILDAKHRWPCTLRLARARTIVQRGILALMKARFTEKLCK